MKRFKILNNSLGWAVFLIAALTYCITVEPTASFWDCPEFILSGNKLEVGHPPGAPFFMLTANFFSLFAGPAKVAFMVNIMSAILSALGIMFMFWSITHLARKLLVGNSKVISTADTITILGSGLVGALAYTWSDTYWFSAVEGEVYGYSSLFTAVVFWLILKWEENADSPHSDRWLVLIAYLVGLSIGVHLLNLLCIPAIVLVVYYKKFPKTSWKGTLLALLISMVIVAIVLYGIVPGVVKVGGWFELLFVNVLGMSFNTGLLIYILLLFGTLIAGIVLTEKGKSQTSIAITFTLSIALLGIPFYGHNVLASVIIGVLVLAGVLTISLLHRSKSVTKPGAKIATKVSVPLVSRRMFNTSFLCMLLIMVGYASYALIVIRSSANTPMDQNSPEDIFTLGTYLNREQYGTRPLLFGPGYDSEIDYENPTTDTSPVYAKVEKKSADEPDRYEIAEYNYEYNYVQNTFFTRMWSSDHAEHYEQWLGGPVTNIVEAKYGDRTGKDFIKVPTFGDNMKFFIRYQVNHMYWRYFLWNFVGRQNDIQGNGEVEYGNWVTGIPFIDDALVGDQETTPAELTENKGHNVYYALPLLLGIIGIIWQLTRGKQGRHQFWIVSMLFFMTGIAIVLYLNQYPNQPRERDYAFAGSFYAFAIWIGLGVAGIAQMFRKLPAKERIISNSIIAAMCLCIPVQMVTQTWDDHDRSGRYACRDFGQNYLNTLPEEGCPIIFTCGDNDTFPLWYNQEVEGERTDARVCNLSYLQTDWYIDQMRRPAYDSPSLPITWQRIDYAGNTNSVIDVLPAEGKLYIDEYISKNPEITELLGNDCYDMNVVTKHWILGAGKETPERKALERMIEYARKQMIDNAGKTMQNIEQEYKILAMRGNISDSDLKRLNEKYSEAHYLLNIANNIDTKNPLVPSEAHIPIDADAVKRSGMKIPLIYSEEFGGQMPKNMVIPFKSQRVLRRDLIIFDMLANANWERPIYMSTTVGTREYPAVLQNYFVHEGLAFRITPFNWAATGESFTDTDKFYNNVMNRFKWGGIKEADKYYADEAITRMVYTHRNLITNLAVSMLEEERPDADIIALLEKVRTELPCEKIPYNAMKDNCVTPDNSRTSLLHIYDALCYNQEMMKEAGSEEYLGDETLNLVKSRRDELAAAVAKNEYEYLVWFNNLSPSERNSQIIVYRIGLLCEVFRTINAEKAGTVSKSDVVNVLLETLNKENDIIKRKYEYHRENKDEFDANSYIDNKVELLAVIYQSLKSLDIKETENSKADVIVEDIFKTMEKLMSL